jgi:hypothetical protein
MVAKQWGRARVTSPGISIHLFTQSFLFDGTPSQMTFNVFPGFQNGAATVSALRFAQDWPTARSIRC